jgi:hypothetical protein
MRQPPPDRVAWAIDGELRGHTIEETLRYLSDCADWHDEIGEQRRAPAGVISPQCEPRLVSWLRRWTGR